MNHPRTHPRRRHSSRTLALLAALLAGVLVFTSACVTSEADQAKAATEPERVPLDSLGDLTLQVGDQKGGTQSLLQAAGELDEPSDRERPEASCRPDRADRAVRHLGSRRSRARLRLG